MSAHIDQQLHHLLSSFRHCSLHVQPSSPAALSAHQRMGTYTFRYPVVACKIKLFQNYFNLPRRPSEIILFQRVETCLKLFQIFFRSSLQLMNIFQHEIILK